MRPRTVAAVLASLLAVRVVAQRRALFAQVRAEQQLRVDRPPLEGAIRFSVVLPAFQEGPRIADAVRSVRAALEPALGAERLEIVVVDDGSTDGTADEARAAGAHQVVRHATNRGKGAAVRTGVLAAQGDVVAFTDADLAYSPDQLLVLLHTVEQGVDVVVGSRRHTDATTLVRARRVREIGGRIINLLTFAVLLGQYRDTQCGIKAFRTDIARVLFGHAQLDGFAFDVELFHLIERYRLSLAEVPVTVVNSSRSSVRTVRDGLALVRDLFRIGALARTGTYRLSDAEAAVLERRAAR
jgi:dolichyl-phosphate beta-glucosyltransferase